MSIQLLDADTINQIAAGEVLERPANLVKELIENSLDAGATQIDIEIDHGGRSLKVSDNGKGMSAKDLELSIARHATSKINKFSDLWSLNTFGFRGEALASASAVSRMTITSRLQGEGHAFQLKNEFGKISAVISVGGEPGTEVFITNLFENVPARLKFLKTDSAEVSNILKSIRAMALSTPTVGFKVRQNGQVKAYYPVAKDFVSRAQDVLGFEKLYVASKKIDNFEVEIIYSSPNDVAHSSQSIWIFVQGRWIQDRGIAKAIFDSYRNLLMHGEYPICVIHLKCNPNVIDINIHPTKSQVKFQNSSDVFRLVHGTLRSELEKAPWLEQVFNKEPTREIASDFTHYNSETLQDSAFAITAFRQKNIEASPMLSGTTLPTARTVEPIQMEYWGNLQILGQANLTYILAQSRHSLILVDQHAAHERVVFEKLFKSWKENKTEIQNLLLPLPIAMEPHFIESILKLTAELMQAGIQIERSGPDAIYVTGIPAIIKESAVENIVEKIARDSHEYGGSFAIEKSIGDIFASMACHSVVRAGQALSNDEMKELLAQMDEFPLSSFCPHGRPVYKEYTFNELDREFGRIL